MNPLKTLKTAIAMAALNALNEPAPPQADTSEGVAPIFQYAGKMDRPGMYQKTWIFQQYDDVTALQFALDGVAPGGRWYGWTLTRLLRINYPLPPTIIPLPPPEEPTDAEPGDEGVMDL